MAGTITAIEVQARNPRRVNVFVDGVFAFAANAEVVAAANLRRGVDLSDEDIVALVAQDEWQKTYDAALHYLSYRPRSESEMRRFLNRRGVTTDVCERVIARLKESGLVDDMAFARFWVENREAFSPRSRRALRAELRSKGVDDDVLAATVQGDDAEAAYEAALKKARSLSPTDRATFLRKLSSFLLRRGFGYGVTAETVERVWQGQGEKGPEDRACAKPLDRDGRE